MEKNLYIDASHPNETRVVLKSKDNIEDYEYEGSKNNLIKNNIYLGKVSRIEPSLQAAFIDFGNVWGVDYDSTLDESNKIRSSTGIAASWLSPLGPMTFLFSTNLASPANV